MDNPGYVALSRQAGLMKRLDIIANNIANVSTAGFRRENTVFAEHIKALPQGDPSLSIATMNRRYVDLSEGVVKETGDRLDFAIEGEGFFLVETPGGQRLTRAGAFTLNPEGEMVTPQGFRVLDAGGGPIVVPGDAGPLSVAADGSVRAGEQAVGRIGVVTAEPGTLEREGDALFVAAEGFAPADTPRVRQGAVEGSNVNAVLEIADLISAQRTYEMGQKIIQDEDERIRQTVRQMGEPVR
ncbi:MAG: flagellar hook-basal body complex protein [Pseudomonadota bacterium]